MHAPDSPISDRDSIRIVENVDPVACPDCGSGFCPEVSRGLRGGELVICCPHCGTPLSRAHLRVLAAMPEEIPAAIAAVPAGCRIRVLRADKSAFECHIPRKPAGRAQTGVLAGILTLLGLGVLVAALGFQSWLATAGIALLAVAITGGFVREFDSETRLTITESRAELVRRDWFLQSRKVIPRGEVESIGLRSWYQQNYEPRYGIQISAGARRLRFGTQLSMLEKAWLVDEIARVTGIPQADAPEARAPRKSFHSRQPLAIQETPDGTVIDFPPGPSVHLWAMGVFCTVAGVLTAHGLSSTGAFWLLYMIPLVLLPVGLFLLIKSLRVRFGRERLIISESGCELRNSRKCLWSVPAGEMCAVRPVPTDLQINNRRVWCGEVLAADRAWRFGCGTHLSQLQQIADLIRQTIPLPLTAKAEAPGTFPV
jgi:hypothetical protein